MKTYSGWEAGKMMERATKTWKVTGDYPEGRRGCCGELGWVETYTEIDGKTYNLRYDRDGWPELEETA
jgi:hypothetical protein